MPIKLAKSAGFCFGVDRALRKIYSLLESGGEVSTLGPIIHNQQVVDDLNKRGVSIVERPLEAVGRTLVLRSHGVSRSVYEEIEVLGIEMVDATCPYVKKIHEIVARAGLEGRTVLIAGDELHPEVVAILGHLRGPGYCFSDEEGLTALILDKNLQDIPLCIVSQTTFQKEIWKKCVSVAEKLCTNAEIFDTICSATYIRQQEAEELAMSSDLMVVIGGRNSSNTAKLGAVCERYTDTMLIETAEELNWKKVMAANRIGVTAGASTPQAIIEEVLRTMSDGRQNIPEEEFSFEEALEQSLKPVYTGAKVKGLVLAITPTEIQVDLGTKHTGFLPLDEISDDPDVTTENAAKIGDELDLVVVKVNDAEGTVMLSKKRFDAMAGYDEILKAHEEGTVLSGVVTSVVKGGVIASVKGTRVFIPASQATARRDDDLHELEKKKVDLKIIEVNKQRRRVIGSIRAVLNDQRKELRDAFWADAEVGKEYKGTVKSITDYGVFVDLGGVDGMIHISELSWNRIKHPSEVVKVGDEVEVYIKDINEETKKISLGYRREEDNPWMILKNTYKEGDEIKVTIVSLVSFGAFAKVIEGIEGLIHISQISYDRVEQVSDVLSVGEEVDVKIVGIDYDKKRVSLSMKALLPEPAREAAPTAQVDEVIYSTDRDDNVISDDLFEDEEVSSKKPAKAKTTEPETEETEAVDETPEPKEEAAPELSEEEEEAMLALGAVVDQVDCGPDEEQKEEK